MAQRDRGPYGDVAAASAKDFLAEATDVLASSLDYDTTLASVTRLAVQGIADWCAVDELLPGGELRRIAVAHPDPQMVRLAHELQQRYPPDPDAPHGVPQVIRSGEPELMREIPDELLVAAARDEEHLRIVRALGLRSYICVPLIARGHVLGALTLVSTREERRYGAEDLQLALELARRAAVAIDNARLYRDSEEARHLLEEQATELEAQASELQQQAWQLEEHQAELEVANLELEEQTREAERAQQEAESAGAILDAFFSAAPVAAAFLDRDLRYRRMNRALAAIEGVEPQDAIGRTLREVVPSLADRLEPLYRRVLATGEPIVNLELTAPRAADPDTPGYYLVNYFPVRPEGESEPLGVGMVALDLTELRQARERERVFAQVLEDSRNEIYLFDAETLRFQQVNRGARENLGYSMEELREMTPVDLKPEFTAERFAELVQPLLSGEGEMVTFETVHRRRDGSLYPVDVRLQLSGAGERPLFVALILDASERKRVEKDLITAREMAEQANEAKSQFLTVMSHELRTPLNAIIGYQDLLEAEIAGPLGDQQKEHLARIKGAAGQLLDLISQILSLARIESGREEVTLQEADGVELVREAVSLVEALATQKGLDLELDLPASPLQLSTDPGKFRQILLNLLSNAIKFTDRGSIRIALSDGGRVAAVRVHDTGAGIPVGFEERVFEPFVQADASQTRRHGGTGLGLAVSRELARLLGGDLRVEETSPRGSVLLLTIPRYS
jgi:PAS domain S-box-containing protein